MEQNLANESVEKERVDKTQGVSPRREVVNPINVRNIVQYLVSEIPPGDDCV